MQIDLNNLPKVDTSKRCEMEGYYFFFNSEGNPDLCLKRKGGTFSSQYAYYGPFEFVPPKVIPPKPDIPLVLVEHCITGSQKWAWKDGAGDYWWRLPGDKGLCSWWTKDNCKIIDQ